MTIDPEKRAEVFRRQDVHDLVDHAIREQFDRAETVARMILDFEEKRDMGEESMRKTHYSEFLMSN